MCGNPSVQIVHWGAAWTSWFRVEVGDQPLNFLVRLEVFQTFPRNAVVLSLGEVCLKWFSDEVDLDEFKMAESLKHQVHSVDR